MEHASGNCATLSRTVDCVGKHLNKSCSWENSSGEKGPKDAELCFSPAFPPFFLDELAFPISPAARLFGIWTHSEFLHTQAGLQRLSTSPKEREAFEIGHFPNVSMWSLFSCGPLQEHFCRLLETTPRQGRRLPLWDHTPTVHL